MWRVPAESGQTAHRVGAVQTDASINPGNSGGALVDCHARLVGINTAGAALPSTPGGSIGLGFAIPVDFARGIADELIASGKVTRPGFGLQVQPISGGLFVQAVTAGGPADKAGLRPGASSSRSTGSRLRASTPWSSRRSRCNRATQLT